MTDRYNALIVVLEQDTRSDDAEATIAAIRQIKGVLSVEPNVADSTDHIAQMRVRTEISEALLKVLHPEWYKDA